MKNKTILSVFLLTVLTVNYAQAQLNFGARAGANFSQVQGTVPIPITFMGASPALKTGLQLGMFGENMFSEKIGIQFGLSFMQQGCKFEATETLIWSMNYLQIPIDLMVKFGKFFLHTGPYVSFGLTGKAKSDGLDDISLFKAIADDGWAMKRFDAGLRSGMGLDFNGFQIGFSVGIGLMNLFSPEDFKGILHGHEAIDTKNLNIALTFAYVFQNNNSRHRSGHRW